MYDFFELDKSNMVISFGKFSFLSFLKISMALSKGTATTTKFISKLSLSKLNLLSIIFFFIAVSSDFFLNHTRKF